MQDFRGKTDEDIDTWIHNHERQGATTTTLYRALIEERNSRHGKGLRISVSIPFLSEAAREGRFVSYGELAERNSVEWTKARHRTFFLIAIQEAGRS